MPLITWDILDKVVEEKEVKVYYNNKRFDLQIGDLICRKGHVEFYIGDNKVVSWGRVHKAYAINKNFKPLLTGYKSNDKEDKDIPFTSFLRFKGGKR